MNEQPTTEPEAQEWWDNLPVAQLKQVQEWFDKNPAPSHRSMVDWCYANCPPLDFS